MQKEEHLENGVDFNADSRGLHTDKRGYLRKSVLAIALIIVCCAISSTIASTLELSVSDVAKKRSRSVPGEIIIEIKEDIVDLGDEKGIVPQEKVIIKSESIEKLNKGYGLISIERLFSGTRKDVPSDIYVFRFSKDVNINEVISTYKEDSGVLYVEPNYTVHIE